MTDGATSDTRLEDLMAFCEFFFEQLRSQRGVISSEFYASNGITLQAVIIFRDLFGDVRQAFLSRTEDFDYLCEPGLIFVSKDFEQQQSAFRLKFQPGWAYFALSYDSRLMRRKI